MNNREWKKHHFNFDNVGEAMLTLFTVMTFEGWPGLVSMHNALNRSEWFKLTYLKKKWDDDCLMRVKVLVTYHLHLAWFLSSSQPLNSSSPSLMGGVEHFSTNSRF